MSRSITHAKLTVIEAVLSKEACHLDLLAAAERRQLDAAISARRFWVPSGPAASSRKNSGHAVLQERGSGKLDLRGKLSEEEEEHLKRLLQLMQVVEPPTISQWNVKPDQNADLNKSHHVVFHM